MDLCVPESECHLLYANHRCSADKIFCLKWLHWRFAAPSLPLASLLLLLFWLLFFKEAVNPLCAQLYWGEGAQAGGSLTAVPLWCRGAPLLGMEESDPQVRVRTLCPGPGLLGAARNCGPNALCSPQSQTSAKSCCSQELMAVSLS